jgi:uncharacterized protein with HEPN domain
MQRDRDRVRLLHMLEHAREAIQLVEGRSRQDLNVDRLLSLAPVRLLEIVGEAAAKVSPKGRSRYPTIPWSEVVSLRNRLIHGYDSVDMDVLWRIIEDDLPTLVRDLASDPGLRDAKELS